MTDQGNSQEKTYVKIYVKGKPYDILVDRIKLVTADPMIVRVPDAPEGIIGISLYEGTVVPYLDLSGEEPRGQDRPATSQIGVLASLDDGRLIGVIVDRVSKQVRLADETLGKQIDDEYGKLLGGGLRD